ncbi:hypothetical protein HOU00_gp312 [Caulobacter phage CcrPW]|uniref:Uncharacterized protein n=1 Tax=Caulobacter phage CcrPW TaxID=2283271 RepID=A0A385EAJ3_9CAUD|nr:hypothetical protein HOU00_gp312 [Caulobacter phage CcrPW]AXQ68813.1 hypothetical protein CcrPW_gp274 [Caulobacter phage CcrPW]
MDVELRKIDTSGEREEVFGRRKRQRRRLNAYDIIHDGVVIGTVRERLVTFENRSPGKMYVNYRWQNPRWFAERLGQNPRYRGGSETRKMEVEGFLRDWTHEQKEAAS